MNSKTKGDMAVGRAISHFIHEGYEVCLPIGDKRDYDFIVEKENMLYRVQVKYAGKYPSKLHCRAALRTTGGNQSFNYSKKYLDNAFDLLFIYTATNKEYVIPWNQVKSRNEIVIECEKYREYLVSTV